MSSNNKHTEATFLNWCADKGWYRDGKSGKWYQIPNQNENNKTAQELSDIFHSEQPTATEDNNTKPVQELLICHELNKRIEAVNKELESDNAYLKLTFNGAIEKNEQLRQSNKELLEALKLASQSIDHFRGSNLWNEGTQQEYLKIDLAISKAEQLLKQ